MAFCHERKFARLFSKFEIAAAGLKRREALGKCGEDALAVGLRIQGTYLTGSAGHPHRLESPAGRLVQRSLKRALE